MYSTPNDFLRLQRALLAGGSLDGSAVLRKDTVDEMFSNQIGDLVFPAHIPTADPLVASSWNGPSGMKWGYGLLLTTDQEPDFRAPGSGPVCGRCRAMHRSGAKVCVRTRTHVDALLPL